MNIRGWIYHKREGKDVIFPVVRYATAKRQQSNPKYIGGENISSLLDNSESKGT